VDRAADEQEVSPTHERAAEPVRRPIDAERGIAPVHRVAPRFEAPDPFASYQGIRRAIGHDFHGPMGITTKHVDVSGVMALGVANRFLSVGDTGIFVDPQLGPKHRGKQKNGEGPGNPWTSRQPRCMNERRSPWLNQSFHVGWRYLALGSGLKTDRIDANA